MGDSVQPGLIFCPTGLPTTSLAPCAQENFLGNVLCLGGIVQHAARICNDTLQMGIHKGAQGTFIPARHALNQCLIWVDHTRFPLKPMIGRVNISHWPWVYKLNSRHLNPCCRAEAVKMPSFVLNAGPDMIRRRPDLHILRLHMAARCDLRATMTMKFRPVLALSLLIFAFEAFVAHAWAQTDIDGWMRQLDRVEAALNAPNTSPDQAEAARWELLQVRDGAIAARSKSLDKMGDSEKLLAALGPAPADGASKEEAAISDKRKHYSDEISQIRAQVQSADLILARVDGLSERISERWRFWVWGRMTKVFPAPWSTKVLTTAGEDISRIGSALWQRLSHPNSTEPRAGISGDTLIFGALVSGIIWVAMAAWLLARYGHRRVQVPTYARKLASAIAHSNAYGLFPAGWAAALGIWIELNGVDGLTAIQSSTLAYALEYAALALVTLSMPSAIYAPSSPLWRLLPVGDDRARVVVRGTGMLGLFTALDLFAVKTVLLVSPPSDQLASVYSAIVYSILAAMSAWLIYARAHSPYIDQLEGGASSLPSVDPSIHGRSAWRDAFIVLTIGPLIFGVIALWVGYTNFGSYLVSSIILTGIVTGGMRAVRDLLSASLGLVIERRIKTALSHAGSSDGHPAIAAFWVQLVIDVLFALVGLFAVALIWGVPLQELITLGEKATGSFRIGTVRLSPIDLVLGGIIFAAGIFAVRRIQFALEHSLLPRTRIDSGARQSIVTGTGYLGIAIATLVSISAVGIDLSNLAIVAGALSVGIGFGLQNITNNFVSGLILLFERPVKVGDWVVVGTTEGLIKNINVRATEIETFDLASVIIPNAELLSHHLTNWTHKDRRGRVEVKISLHPNSDPDEVIAMLLDLARQNTHIVAELPPQVTLSSVVPGVLEFSLRCFTDDVMQRGVIASELRIALVRELRARNIQMSDPGLGQSIGPLIIQKS